MRDEKQYSHFLIKKITTILIIHLIIIATIPSASGLQYTDERFSFLIEFTMPNLIQQINQQSSQRNNYSNLFSHSFHEILTNISLFQQDALTKIKKIVDINPFSSDIKHYHLFFNGIRVSEITEQAAYKLEQLPFIKHVEKDTLIFHSSQSTSIDEHSSSAFINNSSYLLTKSNFTYSGKNISIGFFDTGLDYTHPALLEAYKGGYDFVNEDSDPFDDNGHGTHVIGIAAAQPLENDTSQIITGVAPNASIYVYKVLDEQGQGYTSWFLSAFEQALDPNHDGNFSDHLDIISISAGNPEGSETDLLSTAAKQAVSIGITVVAAAGNDGPLLGTISSPAIAQGVIAVGASIDNEMVAPYSSRGDLYSSVVKPNLVAPGNQIKSTWPNNQYKTLSGTSMATPFVTGIIACLLEKNPDLTPQEIRTILQSTASTLGYNVTAEGYGLINTTNVFEINTPIPANISVYHFSNSNKLLINLSLQNIQSMVTYSVSICPINNHQKNILHLIQLQTDEINTKISVTLENLSTGHYIIFVELYHQQALTRVKQIIFLEGDNQQFSNYPGLVTVGEKFTCSLANTSSFPGSLFIFSVPFKSIQFSFGPNATFTTPLLPFRIKNQITATLLIIKIGFPFKFEKHKITIINNRES